MLYAAASPVSGVPSWNLMPSRILSSQCRKSSLGVSDSTRYGTMLPSASVTYSDSVTARRIIWQLTAHSAA